MPTGFSISTQMYPEFGLIALIFAAFMALLQTVVPLAGIRYGQDRLTASASPLSALVFLSLVVSFYYLTVSFLNDDFSVLYVANNSNSLLPWYYKFSAVWGAHEGSMLLWVLILAGWTMAVALFSRHLESNFRAVALSSQGFLALGFILFLLFTSNPFERLLPFSAPDGSDLNPLLQDIGLIFHPPMLYMGYVGFSVAFSFAVAALVCGKFDPIWAKWLRPWTNIAWAFLTLGISLGSWWAYYELGWGGWWFWDPVENASLMPWLVGTALVHSLAVAEKRNLFQSWTVLLALIAFSLSLLGTFLVRSGVLNSVHAFASDPERGLYILLFLFVVIGGSLFLYGLRMNDLKPTSGFEPLSAEAMLLVNNLLLSLMCAVVLLGTLYPLLVDALGLQSVSVGPPYFNLFLVIFGGPLMVFLGIGQRLRWRSDDLLRVGKAIPVPLILSLVLAFALAALAGSLTPVLVGSLFLALWVVIHLLEDLRSKYQLGALAKTLGSLTWWGMCSAHLGVAVLTVGIGMSTALTESVDVRMEPGTKVDVAGYEFEFDGHYQEPGPNYTAFVGEVYVWKDSLDEAQLYPEKRRYFASGDVLTEAGIDGTLSRDLFVSMGEQLSDTAWAVRIQVKPFIRWVWLGSILMALGGLVAVLDSRYRMAKTAKSAADTESSVVAA
jgi:cytochrome c-type biogenesis protein CcmF